MGKHSARPNEHSVFVPSATTPRRRRRVTASSDAPLQAATPVELAAGASEARVSLFVDERPHTSESEASTPKADILELPVAPALSPVETIIEGLAPIRPVDIQETEEIPQAEMIQLAQAFATGARATKRAPRKLDSYELGRLAAGTVNLPIVAPEDRVPDAPVKLTTGEKMVLAEPRSERPRRIAQGAAASTVAFVAGAAFGLTGGGIATAAPSAALTASLVGGTDQEVSVPAALTGSATASVRSAAQDLTAEAATSAMCTTEGATGLRAAYTNTDNVLVWPVAPGTYTLTSSFGARIDPVYHTVRMHAGQDLAGPIGTPVYAAADGVVVETLGSNNRVLIQHEINGETFYTAYLHMYARDIVVKPGDVVSAGQQIGAIGNYGKSTGPHLHFETHNAAGQPVEPTAFMKAHGAIQITQMCR